MSLVGDMIERRRRFLGMRQREVADALGVSVSYVCDIERGHRLLNPRHRGRFCKLARVLGWEAQVDVIREAAARDRIDAYTKREMDALGK